MKNTPTATDKEKTMDAKINSMNPGDSIIISESGDSRVIAERSGDGQTLRFVRVHDNGSWVTFLTKPFALAR